MHNDVSVNNESAFSVLEYIRWTKICITYMIITSNKNNYIAIVVQTGIASETRIPSEPNEKSWI